MKNKWLIPLIILIALILLNCTRWEIGPSKTYNNGVVTYKSDRWSGVSWGEGFLSIPTSFTESRVTAFYRPMIGDANAFALKDDLSLAWDIATGLAFIWLLISICLTSKPISKSEPMKG
jgi:hypothetical protein